MGQLLFPQHCKYVSLLLIIHGFIGAQHESIKGNVILDASSWLCARMQAKDVWRQGWIMTFLWKHVWEMKQKLRDNKFSSQSSQCMPIRNHKCFTSVLNLHQIRAPSQGTTSSQVKNLHSWNQLGSFTWNGLKCGAVSC